MAAWKSSSEENISPDPYTQIVLGSLLAESAASAPCGENHAEVQFDGMIQVGVHSSIMMRSIHKELNRDSTSACDFAAYDTAEKFKWLTDVIECKEIAKIPDISSWA